MAQSLQNIVYDLAWPYTTASAYAVARWLRFLPEFYGRNRTLDAAVNCFVAHHIGHMTQNVQAVRYSRSTYVKALTALQRALDDHVQSVCPEVLCAVILLCMYEVSFCVLISTMPFTDGSAVCKLHRLDLVDEARQGAGSVGQISRT